ncbi:polycystin-2 [Drosophila mojavensis]|uniref:Uncharacterized protein n=1 Tax=Drosophila mojavensis TaxID=7230 RepID=B4KZE0_DROMO|nr:polycystin-2 [Drosophila mojavensis]EDW18966.1 uncharacterized protein Dmoj_GI13527 [Drosophila mojavensis]
MWSKVVGLLKRSVLLIATIIIMVVCLICVSLLSGYNHKTKKVEGIVIHSFLVMIFLFVLCDPIKFLILAVDRAWWPRRRDSYSVDRTAMIHTRLHYLKMRLKILRSQLVATDKHCNESLNLLYQSIANDLWLYGRYFFLLMCLVLVTWDQLLCYNTKHMESLFVRNNSHGWGLEKVYSFDDFYKFLESTLVEPFDPNFEESGSRWWIYGDHTIKLGGVRLRQLRVKKGYHMGWKDLKYEDRDYMSQWELPYQRLPYTNKYWKIFTPWLSIYPTLTSEEKFFLNFGNQGYAHDFSELYGYVTLLARTAKSSRLVIQYLKDNKWLTHSKTCAIFMDFTLFNMDANMFTVATLALEMTAYGTIEYAVHIESSKLLMLDEFDSLLKILIVFLYILVFVQFGKSVIIMLWCEPKKLRSTWNKLDLVIILLNIALICLLITHQILLNNRLLSVENASVLVFLDFRIPVRVHIAIEVILGFLVCLTTLRLWRVLQFARVFQLIAATLYAAWKALASTAMLILIFLFAFGMAVGIINGNYTIGFASLTRSIISSVCFALGFKRQLNPADLLHGGVYLGLIFYVILAFFIVIVMMNLFITTLRDYFGHIRRKMEARFVFNQITFLQFLRAEYAPIFRYFLELPCFKRGYKRHNRTVHQNIEIALQARSKGYKPKLVFHAQSEDHLNQLRNIEKKEEQLKHDKYKERIERMHTIAALMQTQLELLSHLLFTEAMLARDSEDSMYEASDSASEQEAKYRR